MQVTFNINEKAFNELKDKAQKDGISLEEELEQLIFTNKKQSFYEWVKKVNWKSKENDISLNHDKYLYGKNQLDG